MIRSDAGIVRKEVEVQSLMFFFPYEPPNEDPAAIDFWPPFPTGFEYGMDDYFELHAEGYHLDYIWDRQIEKVMEELPIPAEVSCIEALLEMVLESGGSVEYLPFLEIFRLWRAGNLTEARREWEAQPRPEGSAGWPRPYGYGTRSEGLYIMAEELVGGEAETVWGEDNDVATTLAADFARREMPHAPLMLRNFFGGSFVLPMWIFLNEWRNRCLRRIGWDRVLESTIEG